jgi:flagellar basal-body rod protein FlgB
VFSLYRTDTGYKIAIGTKPETQNTKHQLVNKGDKAVSSPNLFSNTISLLEKSLNLRSKRHQVLAANIANLDTPNYKAFDLVIKEAFDKSTGGSGKIKLERTHANHLPMNADRSDRLTLTQAPEPEFSLRGDGNTVNLDKTMADVAENTLLFKTAAQIISRKFKGLKNVIDGGGK